MEQLIIFIIIICIIIFLILFSYYLYVKPKENVDPSRWGSLLYSKFPYIKIFEYGIKPSRFGFLLFEFIPFENFKGIYKLYFPLGNFLGYVFHYDNGSKRNLKKLGLEGNIFALKISETEFQKITSIMKRQMGNKFDFLYIPNRILTFELTFSTRKFIIKDLKSKEKK